MSWGMGRTERLYQSHGAPAALPAALLVLLFQGTKFLAQPCSSLTSTSSTSTTPRTRWRSRPCTGPRAATSPPVTETLSAITTTAPCWTAPSSSPRACLLVGCPEHTFPSQGQILAGAELGGGRAPEQHWEHQLFAAGSTGASAAWPQGSRDWAAGWRVQDLGAQQDGWCRVLGCGGMEGVELQGMAGWRVWDFGAWWGCPLGPRGFLSCVVFSVPPAATTTRSPRR